MERNSEKEIATLRKIKSLSECMIFNFVYQRTSTCSGKLALKLEKWFPLWGEQAHSLKLFCMYDKRFEISKTKEETEPQS